MFRKPIRYDGLVNETSADRKRLEDSLFMHGTPTEDALAAFSRQDYASAWRNLQPLEDQRDARAQTIIGLMYQAGLGTTKNPEEAAKWFHRAAAQGEVFSEAVLGRLYYFGQGVAKSYIQSVRWFRMAAEAGDAESQYNVGTFYERGFFEQGVDFRIDNREAVKWYRLAARQGHPGALNNLGTFYADGKVLPQDYVRAHAYFNLAAASGEPENAMKSKKNRDKIAARMTKTQLARAQEMASRCEQSHYQNCD